MKAVPLLVALFFASLDLSLKTYVFQLAEVEEKTIGLAQYMNSGFAFSIPLFDFLIIPVTFIALGVFSWVIGLGYFHSHVLKQTGMLLVLFGGLVNFAERLLNGAVRDPLKMFNGYWNIADFMVIGGLLCWLLSNYMHKRLLVRNKKYDR